MSDNYSSFAFFNNNMRISDFPDNKIPDDCIVTSFGEVIRVPVIMDFGDQIRIQSGTEIIYLDKKPKETQEWTITERPEEIEKRTSKPNDAVVLASVLAAWAIIVYLFII